MDDKFQTSQQKAGEHSTPEGDSSGFAMPETDGPEYGDQNAPTGTPVQANVAQSFKTSANIRGQLSKPEGGSGSQNNV